MIFFSTLKPGQMCKPFHGVVYWNHQKNEGVTCPMPFNVIAKLAMEVWSFCVYPGWGSANLAVSYATCRAQLHNSKVKIHELEQRLIKAEDGVEDNPAAPEQDHA